VQRSRFFTARLMTSSASPENTTVRGNPPT
jgi:hypothetical protein